MKDIDREDLMLMVDAGSCQYHGCPFCGAEMFLDAPYVKGRGTKATWIKGSVFKQIKHLLRFHFNDIRRWGLRRMR